MKNYKIISIVFFLALYLPFFAFSQELQGKFHDWSVFKIINQGKSFCYIASLPINISGNIEKTGEAFFLVTKINGDSDEISSSLGSAVPGNSNIELSVGNQKYVLFSYQAMLWANNKIDDINIIKAMQQQADFNITAVLENNKSSVYTYSLIGFKESYSLLKKICK